MQRKRYLEDRGFTAVDIWECEYKQMRKTNDDLKVFRQNYMQGLDVRTAMSENEILSKITGEIFGVVTYQRINKNFPKCLPFSKMLTFLLKL